MSLCSPKNFRVEIADEQGEEKRGEWLFMVKVNESRGVVITCTMTGKLYGLYRETNQCAG